MRIEKTFGRIYPSKAKLVKQNKSLWLEIDANIIEKPQLEAAPGTVTAAGPGGIDIAFKRGILKITEIQAPGKKKMPVDAFLRGNAIEIGRILQ